mmetsp:Transcript_14244/g.22678  ORF Transcript_14244/g.22678 Transcript_14244/m.22678 type:complete len:112 (+) Transcript_14244:160-495(+)
MPPDSPSMPQSPLHCCSSPMATSDMSCSVCHDSSPKALAIGAKHATVTLALPLIPLDYFRRAGPTVVLIVDRLVLKRALRMAPWDHRPRQHTAALCSRRCRERLANKRTCC